ncbi:hypothetical protein [Methylobacterium symbioticum]|uniref:Uncharacterized protein n=1 Tax=Methylobacterium symbioticum TaxID=2584084 RepID=A0A509E6J2_9HYPH|nr:hypothetical protein [Methylobacterium symbioticum]VUD69906.1 hypothetical protein MET9862_00466 [Methylobacterium symbioticum]
MYPPRETQADASESDRRQMDQTEARCGFRPLALPALAAATRAPATVKKPAAETAARRGILDLVHEDAPIL